MKRILLSLMTVALVSGVGVAATRAFFSDVETSQGNSFMAGSIDLKIDSECKYNGEPSTQCGTWGLKDLVPTADKFFNFTDIKPGDYGENTISLHIIDNPAWACVNIGNMTTNGDKGIALAQGLNFFAWNDDGDNIYEPAEERPLFTNTVGPASDVLNGKTYALADKNHGNIPLPAGPTSYIGLAWCAGTLTIAAGNGNMIGNPNLNCNGLTLGNPAQGGSVSADISFYVEQSRNNPDFVCGQTAVSDYLDIGNTTSEIGHNLLGWSDPWVKPGAWGGNYGGGSSDESFRLLLGKGETNGCTEADRDATFTMNAGAGTATKLTLEHLDGLVNDSFDVYINNNFVTHYTAGVSGTESWKKTTFTIPGVTGIVTVKLHATDLVGTWCIDWGQVAFSNAKLE